MPQIVNALHPLYVPSRDGAGAPNGVGDFTAEELRRLIRELHGGNNGGVTSATGLQVTALGTPGSQVLVAPGLCWIPNAFSANGGKYLGILNSQATLDVPAADLSQQRNDAIFFEIQDKDYDTSTVYQARIRYVTNGTLGSGASFPTPSPASSNWQLAQIRVPAGGTTVVNNAAITNINIMAGRAFSGGRLTQQSNIGVFTGAASSFLGQSSAQGPPATGTYVTGDWGFDSKGAQWICTVGGSPGTWLYIGGGPYHAEVFQGASQGIPNNAVTIVAYDTVEADPNSNITTGASFHYTCPLAGRYLVSGAVNYGVSGTGSGAATLLIYKNGAAYRRFTDSVSSLRGFEGAAVVRAAASDTIDLRAYQLSGGTLNTSGTSPETFAQFTYLGV